MRKRRRRVSQARRQETMQEFCEAVYHAVVKELERTGRTEQALDPNTRNDTLWHAHKLWDGTHPKHMGATYRSTKRVSKMVYQLLITEGEGQNAEMATVASQ